MFNWKKKYLKDKLRGVEKMIVDLEFKRFKVGEMREDLRKEYDNLQSKLDVLNSQITSQKDKPTMEKGDIARLDDQKVIIDRDIVRLKEQMDYLQVEVVGAKPTAENHEGVQGVNQQLDALRELKIMIKEYIGQI